MSKKLGWFGGAITLVYLAILGLLVWGRLPQLFDMELNAVGDFLAGAFGPLGMP